MARPNGHYSCAVSSLVLSIGHYLVLGILLLLPHLPDALPGVAKIPLAIIGLYAFLSALFLAPIVTPVTLLLAIIGVFGLARAKLLSLISLALLVPLIILEVLRLPGAWESFGRSPL